MYLSRTALGALASLRDSNDFHTFLDVLNFAAINLNERLLTANPDKALLMRERVVAYRDVHDMVDRILTHAEEHEQRAAERERAQRAQSAEPASDWRDIGSPYANAGR